MKTVERTLRSLRLSLTPGFSPVWPGHEFAAALAAYGVPPPQAVKTASVQSAAPDTGLKPGANEENLRVRVFGICSVPAILLIFTALPLLAADSAPGKFPAPAKVAAPTKEADLANLTLTAEAEKRLGITTVAVERKKMERTRLFGGEVILPAKTGGGTGQSVFTILPSLTPAELVKLAQSQIDADGLIDQAKVTLDAAKVALLRAEQLLKDKAGSARVVDETKAQVGAAEAGLRTAQARRELLGPPVLDAANQPVLWLRVPVYVGDLAKLNTSGEVRVGGLNDAAGAPTLSAKPMSAPPSANAAASTVDLFYEVTNKDGALRLGQKVGVTIPYRGEEESLVTPWSAVMHDIQGGTWVYENTGPQAFARRRVQVSRVVGGDAVLSGGVKPGAKVVDTGAAELFGTEFGVGK